MYSKVLGAGPKPQQLTYAWDHLFHLSRAQRKEYYPENPSTQQIRVLAGMVLGPSGLQSGICTYIYIYVFLGVCIHIYIYMYMFLLIYLFIHLYLYLYYIYTYIDNTHTLIHKRLLESLGFHPPNAERREP